MNPIQSHCSVLFTLHEERQLPDDLKVLILVGPSAVLYFWKNKFSAEQVEKPKLTYHEKMI